MRRYIVLLVLAVAQFTISFPLEASAKRRLSDAVAPALTTLSVPSTAISLTVSGIGIAATDNVGVTGYFLSESPATPAASATGWRIVAPTSYVFSSAGSKTLYAWAKDAAGNVSASKSAAVMITLPDTIAPIVAISAPTNNAVVSGIVTIAAAASDSVGVTKVEFYSNGELSHTAMSAPYSYVVDTRTVPDGSYILVAKAYDRAGNIGSSSPINAKVANTLDVTVPVVNAFTLPSVATSLTIAVSAFTASDNVGVTGYMLRESSTAPLASATGWSASAPTSYVFASTGTKTLYAFAKDAAGNVSASRSAAVTITLPDTTAPTVSISSPANNAVVSDVITITALASDNVGVTRVEFYVNGTLDNTVASAPYSFTADTRTVADGTYTLIAKARDSAGNLGTSSSVSVKVDNSNNSDVTKPIVNTFTMPATASSLTVSVSAFTASDNVGITGYRITESTMPPLAAATDWSAVAPTSFVFSDSGTRTAYAWVKDAAGNVSLSKSAPVAITLSGTTPPTGVIFQTTFDSARTWNPSGGTSACWQGTAVEGAGCAAPAGPIPSSLFTDFRVQAPVCSPVVSSHIGSATDIQTATGYSDFTPYGGSGKSYVHFYEPCMSSSGGWGSDGLLGVFFGKSTGYSELYVQFNVKFQTGFKWSVGAQQKLVHIMHTDGDTYNQGVLQAFNMFDISNKPDFVPSLYTNTVYWPSPQDNPNYYPLESGSANATSMTPTPQPPNGTNISDGNWHTVKYRVKLNSGANSPDGIATTWLDGVVQTSKTNLLWTLATPPSVSAHGFNRVIIGGNSSNTWLNASSSAANPPCAATRTCPNQWYALDNLVISTTDISTGYVPTSDIAPREPSPSPSPSVPAGVIFQDSFDAQPDWNTSGQVEGKECISTQSLCSAADYPKNYNFFRSVPFTSGYSPVAQIKRLPGGLPDHTGTGTGKAFIVTNESVSTTTPFPSDGYIGKHFSAAYPELYVRFWARTQSGYRTLNSSQSKVLRFASWDGGGNAFSWDYPQAPAFFWDWSTYNDGVATWMPSYRCDNVNRAYYCSSSVNTYQRMDYQQDWTNSDGSVNNPLPGGTGGFADGQWHRYDFHIKYNSAPNVANGVFSFKLDGKEMVGNRSSSGNYPATNVVFRETGSTKTGFNIFAIGGNSSNKYDTSPGIHEQWYAIDDLVVSTTPIPDNYIIGSAGQ